MDNHKENLKLDQGLKLIVKSSLIVFMGYFLSKVLTYLYRIIVARSFGAEVYGLFSLALMIVTWFSLLPAFGLFDGLLRYVSLYRGKEQKNRIGYIFKFTITLLIFSGILSGIILFFLSEFISINLFHNPNLIIFLRIFSISVPFSIILGVFLSIIRAYEKISLYSFITNILQNSVRVILLIFFVFLGFKINSIIFSYLLGIIISFLVAYLFCKYKIPEIFQRYQLSKDLKIKSRNELLSYSWPVMFSGLIMCLFTGVDSFSIGYFHDATQVGYYNAALPLVALLGFIPEIFLQLFFPLITKEFSKRDFKFIKGLTQQVGKWIFILNLPIFFILMIFPEQIINLLFGQEYVFAANALRFLLIGGFFFSSLVSLSNSLISMIGKSKLILTNLIVISLLNLILNFLLVPKYGINGAAFATMVSWIIFTITLLFELKIYVKIIPFKKSFFKIFLFSSISAIILIYLKQQVSINLISLILLSVFFFLIYIILLFTTHCLDKNDFMILGAFKKKLFGIRQDLKKNE